MLTNKSVNYTHYCKLIDALENVSDTSVKSMGFIESSIRRGRAEVYYSVKSFYSKEDALIFLVNEVYEDGRPVWWNKTGIFYRITFTL